MRPVLETTESERPVSIPEQIQLILEEKHFAYEQDEEGDSDMFLLTMTGQWGEYDVIFSWFPDAHALHLEVSSSCESLGSRGAESYRLLNLVNRQLGNGSFVLGSDEHTLIYQNSLILAGCSVIRPEQCMEMLTLAGYLIDQYIPAFQQVFWAGIKAEDAMAAVHFVTVGNA